jgi:hypothetical protein
VICSPFRTLVNFWINPSCFSYIRFCSSQVAFSLLRFAADMESKRLIIETEAYRRCEVYNGPVVVQPAKIGDTTITEMPSIFWFELDRFVIIFNCSFPVLPFEINSSVIFLWRAHSPDRSGSLHRNILAPDPTASRSEMHTPD